MQTPILYSTYFGAQCEYYLSALDRHLVGKYCGFSVGGFFLGFLWMLYRKMYKEGAIVFCSVVLYYISIRYLFEFNVIPQNIYYLLDGLSMFVIPLFFGLFGNKLYVIKAVKTVDKLEESNLNEDEKQLKAKRIGGVSWLAPVLFTIVVFTLSLWSSLV